MYNKAWKLFNNCRFLTKMNPTAAIFKCKVIQTREVRATLNSLNASNAVGSDNIPARLIKDGSDQLVATLCFLASESLESGLFPNSE